MGDIRKAVADLSKHLPEKVSLPGDEAYKSTEDGYYAKQAEELKPACVVHPENTADISTILKVLSESGVQFAVRSGGHNINPNAANINDGVTINLRRMTQVSVNTQKTLVSVASGCKWHDVYSTLDEQGLATSGGRLSDVGVGGLTTGGGISYFSGRYGLVCDNVENYEVVLASGEIVEANQNHNGDLWLALKGGSSNFGIVSRFDLRTFPQGELFGGFIVYPYSSTPEILRHLHDITANFDPFVAVIINLRWSGDLSSSYITAVLDYTKSEADPPALKPFLKTEPQQLNTMKMSSLTEVAMTASKLAPKSTRTVWATTTFKCDLEFLLKAHKMWEQYHSKVSEIPGLLWDLTVQPFPPLFSQSSAHLGGNSLGLDAATDGPLILFLAVATWDNAADDAAVNTATRELVEQIDLAAKKAGAYNRFRYLNYAADWQDIFEGYGESSKSRLQAVSQKYDPQGAFQRKCTGGFKLSSGID